MRSNTFKGKNTYLEQSVFAAYVVGRKQIAKFSDRKIKSNKIMEEELQQCMLQVENNIVNSKIIINKLVQ